MSQQIMALLAIATLGVPGFILIAVAVIIKTRAISRNKKCTALTTGTIIDHLYYGDGRMAPLAEYEVNGQKFNCKKKFNGIKKSVRVPSSELSTAWEDEKGWLHVKSGVQVSFDRIMSELWPIGKEVDIHYNPVNPQNSYFGIPTTNTFLVNMFLAGGILMVVLGLVMSYLANAGML